MNDVTTFVLASWAATFLTLGVMIGQLRKSLAFLLKPSFIVIGALHLQLQWTSAIQSRAIFAYLPLPWDFFVVVHILPLVAAILCSGIGLRNAFVLLQRVRVTTTSKAEFMPPASLTILSCASLFVFAWYLSVVPPTRTGLYALVFAPETAALVRETTMKGLSSTGLKYSYAIFSSTLAPLLAIHFCLRAVSALKQRDPQTFTTSALAVGLLLIGVSIYGARGPSALIMLAAFFGIYVSRARSIAIRRLLLIAAFALLGPTIISAYSSRQEFSLAGLSAEYLNILDRALGRGIEDGLWHFHYAQTRAPFGIAGLGNIATIFGYEPINIFNVVGRAYSSTKITTVSSNTAFSLANYTCFGLISFVPSLLMLCGLEGLGVLYSRIDRRHLLPVLAATQIACINLAHTMFTAVFITFGVALLPIVGFILSSLSLTRIRKPVRLNHLSERLTES